MPQRRQEQRDGDRPSPKFRSPSECGADEPPSNFRPIVTQAGDAHQIKILKVEPVPVRNDLRAYVHVQVDVWGFQVEIHQNGCHRAVVRFPEGRDTKARRVPVVWCTDPALMRAVERACLRAWLEAPV